MNFRLAVLLAVCLSLAIPGLSQEVPAAKTYPVEKLTLSYYYYWYQGDPKKSVPAEGVKLPDGSSQFTSVPLDGIGPWFSALRTQWHKDQLPDVRKAGIDVILPVYLGDATSKKSWSTQGLDCLVQAMKELSSTQKEVPSVWMFLDAKALDNQYGGKHPDLKQDELIFYCL
jgi:hypothetical protein